MAPGQQGATTPENRGVYMISTAAELAGVHPQTLRVYERRGLLDPERSAGNTRRYSEADIARLRRITQLTEIGLNLVGVGLLLEMQDKMNQMVQEVEALRSALDSAQREVTLRVAEAHGEYRRELVPFISRLPAVRNRGRGDRAR